MEGTPFGRYRLIEVIGTGSVGEVYRAFDTDTRRDVAVKVLAAHVAADTTFRERFKREALVTAQLRDPHVIPIHAFGEIDGRLFLDMRLIDGSDLRTVIRTRGEHLLPAIAVWYVEQVAGALDAAHGHGLLHRDVKPSNMLVSARGFVYLIDFGIARGTADSSLTNVGTTVGTMAYMAPERFGRLGAGPSSDVYSLACVLHECLTGHPPYPGDTLEQQVAAHLTSEPPQPTRLRPELPADFDAVIARGMAKDPEDRYATAAELAAAARKALDGRSSAASDDSQPVAPDGASSPDSESESTGAAVDSDRDDSTVAVSAAAPMTVAAAAPTARSISGTDSAAGSPAGVSADLRGGPEDATTALGLMSTAEASSTNGSDVVRTDDPSPRGPVRRRRAIMLVGAATILVAGVGAAGAGFLRGEQGAAPTSVASAAAVDAAPTSSPVAEPTTAAAALPPSSSAETTAPTSTPATTSSAPPSSTTSAGDTPSFEQMSAFVRNYYGLLPGNSDQAWNDLGTDYAASTGRGGYDSFWAGITSVTVTSIQQRNASSVIVGLTYRTTSGSTDSEQRWLRVGVDGNGALRITDSGRM